MPKARRFAARGRPLRRAHAARVTEPPGGASAADLRAPHLPHARNRSALFWLRFGAPCRRRRKHGGLPHVAGRAKPTAQRATL